MMQKTKASTRRKPALKKWHAIGMATELSRNEDSLKNLGFVKKGKDMMGRTKWRLKVPYYHYEFQLVLSPYPKTNGNCGILSIYSPAQEGIMYTSRGRTKKISEPEFERAIAWGVDSFERLHAIIVALTFQNL